jgi:hypothetical protein
MGLAHREASEASDRNIGIARQSLAQRRRHIRQRQVGSGQCVVAGNGAAGSAHGDIARGHQPAHILARLFAKVSIKRRGAAGKDLPVMLSGERRDPERGRHPNRGSVAHAPYALARAPEQALAG